MRAELMPLFDGVKGEMRSKGGLDEHTDLQQAMPLFQVNHETTNHCHVVNSPTHMAGYLGRPPKYTARQKRRPISIAGTSRGISIVSSDRRRSDSPIRPQYRALQIKPASGRTSGWGWGVVAFIQFNDSLSKI